MEEEVNTKSEEFIAATKNEVVHTNPMPSSSHTDEMVKAARKSKRKGWIHCPSVPSHHHQARPYMTTKYQPPSPAGPAYDDEEIRHDMMENVAMDAGDLQHIDQKRKTIAEDVEGIEYDSSFTRLGRMGVWHPEASVIKGWPEGYPLYVVPSHKELEERYKLPIKRLRKREDGLGGATLFKPEHPLPPPCVEDVVMQHCLLPKDARITSELPSRGGWNQILQGYKTGLKRGLGGQSIGPRKKVEGQSSTSTRPAKKIDVIPDPSTALEFPNLKSGDDVVRFFLEQEEEPRVKFFYCNQVDCGKVFLPYDLEVVKREDCNDEYFCISPNGIVHIEPDQGTLITILGQ